MLSKSLASLVSCQPYMQRERERERERELAVAQPAGSAVAVVGPWWQEFSSSAFHREPVTSIALAGSHLLPLKCCRGLQGEPHPASLLLPLASSSAVCTVRVSASVATLRQCTGRR